MSFAKTCDTSVCFCTLSYGTDHIKIRINPVFNQTHWIFEFHENYPKSGVNDSILDRKSPVISHFISSRSLSNFV